LQDQNTAILAAVNQSFVNSLDPDGSTNLGPVDAVKIIDASALIDLPMNSTREDCMAHIGGIVNGMTNGTMPLL